MTVETDIERDLRHRLAPHEIRHAARQMSFRLGREALPQEVGDHQAQHPVAEKFKPLVMALARTAPALAALQVDCARMGQRLGKQGRPGEDMADRRGKIVV